MNSPNWKLEQEENASKYNKTLYPRKEKCTMVYCALVHVPSPPEREVHTKTSKDAGVF